MIEEMNIKTVPNIIVITDNQELLNSLKDYPVITEIYDSKSGKDEILEKIKKLKIDISKEDNVRIMKDKVFSELVYVGFNPKHIGTQYLLEAILYIYKNKDKKLMNNIENNVYKLIAEQYHRTKESVKSSILKATNAMYEESDFSKLEKYFSLMDNYKPTPKVIISTILLKICNIIL